MRVFLQKIQKSLNVGKIRNFDEERVFFKEKTFSTFWKLSSQKCEGAKFAVAGGRLVFFKKKSKLLAFWDKKIEAQDIFNLKHTVIRRTNDEFYVILGTSIDYRRTPDKFCLPRVFPLWNEQ